MKAGFVPEHHHMDIWLDLFDKLTGENIDDIGVYIRRYQSDRPAAAWTDRTDYIQPVILCLTHRPRPRTLPGPYTRYCALLTEPGLILKPYFYFFARMFRFDLLQRFNEVFLNSSWAFGSAFSCCGRGQRHEYPRRYNKSYTPRNE